MEIDRMTETELLDQLIEECAELIHACIKLRRSYAHLTPVINTQARANLVEEMADVSVVQAVVMQRVLTDAEREMMFEIETQKANRWEQRLKEAYADER